MRNPFKSDSWDDPQGTVQLIKRVFSENFRTYVPKYLLAFVFMGLIAATTAASAWIMRDVVNEVFVNKDPFMVYAIGVFVLVVYTVKGVATYGQIVVLSRVGNQITKDLNGRMFDVLLRQDQAYYDKHSLAEIGVQVGQGVGAVRATLDLIVTSLGRDVLTLIGLTFVMIYQNPLLSVFALITMPPAVIGVTFLIRRVKEYVKRQVVSSAKVSAVTQETVLGNRIVRAFGMQKVMRDKMEVGLLEIQKQSNKIASLTARTSPLMDTLGGCAIALVIFYGGYAVIELGQDPGALFSFITALLLAYDPARRLARLNINLGKQMVGLRILYALVDRKPELHDAENARDLEIENGEIVFSDVAFSYGENAALRGTSFKAEAGKMTALVGASGAGKSTVFALVERFYDPQSGEILIDGQPIRDVTQVSLRNKIAYVSQDSFLFDLSIRENIAIGRPDATQEQIEAAAIGANAHDFISALPEGYKTRAGQGGSNLSGGQKQRIAIARAMLIDAPILLLDEATSALDAESENKIQAALEKLMQGRTTLVIAHRLSTVRHAHQIHVMGDGKVIESGNHNELFEHDGIYRRLCELQFQSKTEAAE
ncbi:ABC transporter ATP-binding protein [Roseibium album]|uniref:Lipid A export ATP-binding/permease protein MsbA n=1 Tax=Roseibium album TaxID=311410 RepID=A0A0M6ZFV7_9HYPH|nr:ABC transporter ATP-binding protein [Roseibium album]MBG6146648.1 ATP-binding cassette subfamily B protein [Labrenzia sp. EL_142]CTQ61668.1 Lipid A export ATP-binding/permease protein MsbA [Roseibium album]CTQ75549.1 Lipid A export ATP-binding/permease protein MsbA [Roseibium album]CTQ78259.1 Lipid A export ATP-binding/permease protein MsbA [Roseibium album]